jgi:hypothetical protein
VVIGDVDAVEALSELVLATTRHSGSARGQLESAAAAVSAWMRTYVEVRAVEDFTFEPGT